MPMPLPFTGEPAAAMAEVHIAGGGTLEFQELGGVALIVAGGALRLESEASAEITAGGSLELLVHEAAIVVVAGGSLTISKAQAAVAITAGGELSLFSYAAGVTITAGGSLNFRITGELQADTDIFAGGSLAFTSLEGDVLISSLASSLAMQMAILGPFYAEAGQIFCPGAEAGLVSTQEGVDVDAAGEPAGLLLDS